MRVIIALILIVAGAGLVWHGFQVRESLKGKAQQAGADVHQAWNGGTSVPDATWFMVGGGVLVVAGVVVAVKK